MFNVNTVQNSLNQKHLDLILVKNLVFNDPTTPKLSTANEVTNIPQKPSRNYIWQTQQCTIF